MTWVELVIDVDGVVGAYLMGRLFAAASKTSHHEISDGIDLWMDSLSSEDIAQIILRLADEGVRPLHRKRYLRWAEAIRNRAADRSS